MITLEKARKALEASEKKARELGVAVSTVVVDEHGTLVAASKMDGALPISPRFAMSKAFTSASLGLPTENLAHYATEGKPYFGITTLFGGELTCMAGGQPVMALGKLAGGVGVGGSTNVNQDAQCALEAKKVLEQG